MLVLSRKVGEVINIGDDIQIKVIGIEGNRVKLAVGAPRSIQVCLAEKLEQRMSAALSGALDVAGEVIEQVIPLKSYMRRASVQRMPRVA